MHMHGLLTGYQTVQMYIEYRSINKCFYSEKERFHLMALK
jgi:hypothetical protein